MQLDGENSPATFTRLFDVREEGEYQGIAELARSINGQTELTYAKSGIVTVR
jgi:hypothetical protein